MILNSPIISGSLTVTGNIIASGSITLSGSVASASYADTASFVALAQSASNAVSAATASFANAFTVASTLTAQTLVVQTITSSVDFVTGSTRFGSTGSNTHQFTGSVSITGSLDVITNGTEFQVNANGVKFGNVIGDAHNITGSVGISGSAIFAGLITGQNSIYQTNAAGIIASNRFGTYNGGATQLFFEYPSAGSVAFNNGSDKLVISLEGNLLVSSGATIYNSSGALFIRSGTSGDLILGSGGSNDKMRITSGSEVVRGPIREFAQALNPPDPYTGDARLNITHNAWGGNNDSGTVYVEFQARAYGNNQTTCAYGIITYRLGDNGINVTNVSTAGVTVSNVTITTDVSSNYILRIRFGVTQNTDRIALFARTTNGVVTSISADIV